MQAEAARSHRTLMDSGSLDVTLTKRLRKGLQIDDETLAANISARRSLRAILSAEVFKDAQAIVMPILTMRTPPCGMRSPRARVSNRKHFTSSAAGPALPTFSVFPPSRYRPGLTIAPCQLRSRSSADRESDHALIALAAAVQKRTDWHARIPAAVSDQVISSYKGRLA